MFNNSKYGNLLTILLIITIIAIIGILFIIGYKVYKAHEINIGAVEAVKEFESNINENNETEDENNILDNSSWVDNGNSLNITNTTALITTGTTASTSKKKTTQYNGFDVIGTIEIPSINLKYPILEQLSKKSLETSVVLLYTSNGINKEGNTVIIGHNYRNGTMFSKIKKLENGDIIYVTDTSGKKVKYTVYNVYRTSGSDSEYMTRNTNGKREISLSTCTDDSKARTIVVAKEN